MEMKTLLQFPWKSSNEETVMREKIFDTSKNLFTRLAGEMKQLKNILLPQIKELKCYIKWLKTLQLKLKIN